MRILFLTILILTIGSISAQTQDLEKYIVEDVNHPRIDSSFLCPVPNSSTYAALSFSSIYPIDLESLFSHWDTTRVNPYGRKRGIRDPFLVEFHDVECASPIHGDLVITSRFGRRRRGPHRGIDLDLITGDDVMSILPGKVRFVGYSRGHGKTVVVRHDNDVETVYAHLSAYHVKTNDVVEKGQVIGLGGATGNARGSHLHFEIRHRGLCVHPEYLIDFAGSKKIRGKQLWVTSGYVNPLNHSSYRQSKIDALPSYEMAIAAQRNERKIYVVKKGDTLSHIARRNNMRVRDLLAMNPLSLKSVLRIGQHIILNP